MNYHYLVVMTFSYAPSNQETFWRVKWQDVGNPCFLLLLPEAPLASDNDHAFGSVWSGLHGTGFHLYHISQDSRTSILDIPILGPIQWVLPYFCCTLIMNCCFGIPCLWNQQPIKYKKMTTPADVSCIFPWFFLAAKATVKPWSPWLPVSFWPTEDS